jgi:PAS domain S-box-containing protein
LSLSPSPSLENKKRRVPIWLTTLIVIIMILLFSLLINHAREKEVVEQFSRQQMAIARGAAAGIEDLVSSVEKSMIIHSRARGAEKAESDLTLANIKLIYEDLEGKVEFIAKESESGSNLLAYPPSFRMDFVLKRTELQGLIREIRTKRSARVSDLLWIDRKDSGGAERRHPLIIVAVPRLDGDNRISGVVYAALSLSAIVDRYIQPAKDNFSCDAWIIDERGVILFHSDRRLAGVDVSRMEGKDPGSAMSLKETMLRGEGGLGDYYLRDEKDRIEKNIVAHAPIHLGSQKWFIAVSFPYQAAVSHLKKTFFILMLEAFVLIITVIIGSALILYSGRKRFMLEEELKRFKERDDWQEKLAREKKTIEGMIEGSPIPTFVIDRDHRIIFWNRACEELTGCRAEDMIGTDRQYTPFYAEKRPVIADVIVDDDIEGLEKYYGKKRVQKSAVVEGAYEASDFYENLGGKRRHLYFLAAPIYDENGRVIAAIETLQDVTREREMERDLKEYAETLKNELYENIKLKKTIEGMIEGSPIPTFVIDRDHRIIFWNRACEELTGCRAEDMIGTDRQYTPFYAEKRPVIADVIVDDDIEGLEKYYGKKRVQKSAVVEGAYEASDFYENLGGKRRHLYFLAAPIYDENGRVIAAIETLQDVTREREMERDLKEYAETLKNELYENIKLRKDIEEVYNYLQTIMDSSPDRIFALGSDGVINYVSRELNMEAGLTQGKMEGKHFTEFVLPEQKDFMLRKWEEIKQGHYRPYEIEAIARDGSKRSLLITPRPIKGTDRYILVQRDITEFKNLEKKFYESQKLAAVGQLSAGIAHEVRNPLSSIKMSLQILEKRLHPEGNDLKRFKIAEKEVEHLEKLVSDILIFAKPLEPEMKKADIHAFLENSLTMAEKEIADKAIEVQKRFDRSIAAVNFDSAMLKQALLNIYLNAIDAMDKGGRLIIATRAVRENNQPAVVIEIEDSGSGIDAEDLPHLFNPFFTKKKYGTGLGLTQVKKIIDLHQGTIEIVSGKEKGTKVVIALPVQ